MSERPTSRERSCLEVAPGRPYQRPGPRRPGGRRIRNQLAPRSHRRWRPRGGRPRANRGGRAPPTSRIVTTGRHPRRFRIPVGCEPGVRTRRGARSRPACVGGFEGWPGRDSPVHRFRRFRSISHVPRERESQQDDEIISHGTAFSMREIKKTSVARRCATASELVRFYASTAHDLHHIVLISSPYWSFVPSPVPG